MMDAVGDDYRALLGFFHELGYGVAVLDVNGKDVERISYETATEMLSDPGSVHGDPTRAHIDLIFTPVPATV